MEGKGHEKSEGVNIRWGYNIGGLYNSIHTYRYSRYVTIKSYIIYDLEISNIHRQ